MMRICPKCGDYSAESSLAFCPADGTPLVNLDPSSEKWGQGAKVIEKKQQALRQQKRRLKWRRVVLSTMTILTLVAFVLGAVRSRFYLEPPQSPMLTATPTVTGTPTPMPATPTPTSTPTPTPTPDCSGDDKDVEQSLPNHWQEDIRSECAKFNVDTPVGPQTATTIFDPIGVSFKSCIAFVTIKYSCQITVNKKAKSLLPGKPKGFRCEKKKGEWVCRPI